MKLHIEDISFPLANVMYVSIVFHCFGQPHMVADFGCYKSQYLSLWWILSKHVALLSDIPAIC